MGLVLTGTLLLSAGCSADGTASKGGSAASGADGSGAQLSCEPGGQTTCYCPDGTASGVQTCDSAGKASACAGCAAQSAPVEPLEDGKVCSMLDGQDGCTDSSFRSQQLPASVLFIVDRSGSMNCNTPGDGQTTEECESAAKRKLADKPSKWEITKGALQNVLGNLVGTTASVGLAMFSNDDDCGVTSTPVVAIAPMTAGHLQSLTSQLDAVVPSGGTPIVGATTLGYAYLHEEAGRDPTTGTCASPPCGAPGNRYVVLITDGADSCPTEPMPGACGGVACTDHLLDSTTGMAASVNIRTFVIGAPGSESARGFLSELAFRGGTAKHGGACAHDRAADSGDCHFDMTTGDDFAGQLSSALAEISGSALGCEFPVPQPVGAETRNVNVQYRSGGTGAPICFGQEDGACEDAADGWQFARKADGTEDLSKVVLCGGACELVRNDPAIQVDVVLGCSPIILE